MEHQLPEPVDLERVLADDQLADAAGDRMRRRHLDDRARDVRGRVRLADPDHALVGVHPDEERVLRAVGAARVDLVEAEHDGLDVDDLHAAIPTHPLTRERRTASAERQDGLVTGGANGIGRAIVERFVADGRDCRRGRRGAGPRIWARPSSASSSTYSATERLEELVDDVETRVGPLDVLVNNAGIYEPAPAVELTLESYRRVLAVNLDAPGLSRVARRGPDGEARLRPHRQHHVDPRPLR